MKITCLFYKTQKEEMIEETQLNDNNKKRKIERKNGAGKLRSTKFNTSLLYLLGEKLRA